MIVRKSDAVRFTIIDETSKRQLPTQTSTLSVLNDSFLCQARNTVLQLAHESCFCQMDWIGPHSVLVAAPPGSGKTTLLNDIVSHLQGNSLSHHLTLLFLSTSQLCAIENFAQDITTPSALCDTLLNFVNQLSPISTQRQELINWVIKCPNFPPLLFVVDDLDPILNPDSPETTLISNSLLNFLKILTMPTFSSPLFFISSTSIPESKISSRFLGTPGFEVIITLPLPQGQDRETIFQLCFEKIIREFDAESDKVFQPFESEDSDIDTMKSWVSHAATLTAGYLPGDLIKIVRRMVTLSASTLSKPHSTYKFHWNDFLNALNMIPPHQLLSIQDELFDNGGTRGGIVVEGRISHLSWSDFAGYEKEKSYVQNLLNRFRISGRSDKYLSGEIAAPRGLLICGESGSGKSYFAKIIAAEV